VMRLLTLAASTRAVRTTCGQGSVRDQKRRGGARFSLRTKSVCVWGGGCTGAQQTKPDAGWRAATCPNHPRLWTPPAAHGQGAGLCTKHRGPRSAHQARRADLPIIKGSEIQIRAAHAQHDPDVEAYAAIDSGPTSCNPTAPP
jgi:hypothetical protein